MLIIWVNFHVLPILYMMKREITSQYQSQMQKKKKNPNFQISCDNNFSTNILDVILSIKQDLMCIWVFQGREGDDRG